MTRQGNFFVYQGEFSFQNLIDFRVHFGSKTSSRNPQMKQYILGRRSDIDIFDLNKVYQMLNISLNFLYKMGRKGKKVLFVNTLQSSASVVEKYALRCGQFYVNYKWLGGLLTNWYTVSKSIRLLSSYDKILSEKEEVDLVKKEKLKIKKKKDNLIKILGGIVEMKGRPDVLFVIDTVRNQTAIKEAKSLGIPVVAVCDTNSILDGVTHIIPGNDSSKIAIDFYLKLASDALLSGIRDDMKESGVDIEKLIYKKKDKNLNSPINVDNNDNIGSEENNLETYEEKNL